MFSSGERFPQKRRVIFGDFYKLEMEDPVLEEAEQAQLPGKNSTAVRTKTGVGCRVQIVGRTDRSPLESSRKKFEVRGKLLASMSKNFLSLRSLRLRVRKRLPPHRPSSPPAHQVHVHVPDDLSRFSPAVDQNLVPRLDSLRLSHPLSG